MREVNRFLVPLGILQRPHASCGEPVVFAVDYDAQSAELADVWEMLREVRKRCSLPDWSRSRIDEWLERNP